MAARRRRHVADEQKRTTQRVNLQVDVESYRRLLLHGIMSNEQPGVIVSRLIDEHLREYRVQRNPSARVISPESATSEGHGESTSEIAA